MGKLHDFSTLTAELWLARGLHASSVFEGLTTPEIRRERIRREILDRGMADVVAGGRSAGKPETWAGLFLRVYGEELEPEQLSLTQSVEV